MNVTVPACLPILVKSLRDDYYQATLDGQGYGDPCIRQIITFGNMLKAKNGGKEVIMIDDYGSSATKLTVWGAKNAQIFQSNGGKLGQAAAPAATTAPATTMAPATARIGFRSKARGRSRGKSRSRSRSRSRTRSRTMSRGRTRSRR